MSRTILARGASAGVLLAALAIAAPAFADTPSGPSSTQVEGVVVTGSFIAGTPEDAAVPVEATNLQDLRNQGSPTTIDLVKNLSEIGSVAGEANRNNAFSIGAASINLRALSASRTVVVFNGRRFPEQYSASVGRFNNIAIIPNAAIGRIEILKDGGATTYGADAIGGVVNFITRRNVNGLELSSSYRYIPGGSGDWDANITAGRSFDNFNIWGVASYSHRSELDLGERDDWALVPYLINPTSWSGVGNPGSMVFQPQTALNTFGTPVTPTASANTLIRPQVSATGLVRDPGCLALGGYAGYSATPSPLCYFQFGRGQNLVEEQTTWQAYLETNYTLNDYLRFHGEFMLYQLDIPHIPIDNGGALLGNVPFAPGSTTGATRTCGAGGALGGCYTVPLTNPAAADMLSRIRNADGTPAFTAANITALTNPALPGRIGLPISVWRPFAEGGNPAGDLDLQHNYSTTLRYTAEFSGAIPEFLGTHLRWTGAFTLNTLDYTIESKDILIDRLQDALDGFGGTACNVAAGRLANTPGQNGCQYFNPFSSAVATSAYSGQANTATLVNTGTFTGYTAGQGLQNNAALIRSMYVPISLRRTSQYAIIDALISGPTSIHLWSDDPVSIAFGGQYRRFHERTNLSDYADRALNPCATPGVNTCASRTGPLAFNRGINLTGLTLDDDRTYPVAAGFYEIQAPMFNRLTLNISGRYEKFFSDVSNVNNDVFVNQVAARWQATDWLVLRATAGQTFSQVNPPPSGCGTTQTPSVPTSGCPQVAANQAAPAQFGATTVLFTTDNYPNFNVRPETGFNYNIGAVVNFGSFQGSIDYYRVKVDDILRPLTTGNIITAIVAPGELGATAHINCSSPLVTANDPLLGGHPFVQLNGACVQGVSALNSTAGNGGLSGGAVNFFGGQGTQPNLFNGGSVETTGIDVSGTWHGDDIFGGRLTISADATWTLTYRVSDFLVGGVVVAVGYDGVGLYGSTNAGHNGQRVPEYRGSISFNYNHGPHNFNWTTRYVSSMINDDNLGLFAGTLNNFNSNVGDAQGIQQCQALASTTTPPATPGAGTALYGAFCGQQNVAILAGRKESAQFNTDVTYRLTLPWQTTFTVSVQNLFDSNPPFSRDLLNYDAFFASPLGRTIRLEVLKRF